MSNIFIKFPNLQGSVTSDQHKGWVATNYVSFGGTWPVSTHVGRTTDRGSAVSKFSNVIVTKQLDDATIHLFQNFCRHTVMDQVEINVCSTDSSLKPYVKYILSDVVIAGHEHVITADSVPTEELQLNYTKIEVSYIGRDNKQGNLAPSIMGYDMVTAKVL